MRRKDFEDEQNDATVLARYDRTVDMIEVLRNRDIIPWMFLMICSARLQDGCQRFLVTLSHIR